MENSRSYFPVLMILDYMLLIMVGMKVVQYVEKETQDTMRKGI